MATTAVSDDDPVAEMESLLTCTICLKTLKDPRTLGCFHSYCKACLEKYVKEQREKEAEKMIEAFDCPGCTSTFSLKHGEQVEGMLPNNFIKNQLEIHAIQYHAKELPCFCESGASAVSRCTTCDKYLCSKCLTTHQNWPDFKKHIVLTMDELAKPENQEKAREKLRCLKHENMPCEIYCQTCKEFVCEYCTESKHAKPDHSYLPLAELIRKPERESLSASSAILNAELNGGKEALQEIENATQLLKKNAEKTKNDIIQHKQEIIKQEQEALKVLIQKIEEKATLLMNEVDQKYNEVYESLVKQKTKVETYMKKVKGSDKLTKNLLEKGSPEEMLSLQKDIGENVEKVKSERPHQMKPIHDGDVQYKVKVTQTDITQYTTSILKKLGEVVCNPIKLVSCQQSVILNANFEYGKQMEEWLGNRFQWHLCYQASRDGWQAQDFHKCCDNKGPTVTLVKVGDYIFGGYTDQSWAGQAGYKQSNSSFLFSLKNKDNIPAFRCNIFQNKQNAIYGNPGHGPVFGGGNDFYISPNSNLNQQSCSYLGHTYQPPTGYQSGSAQTKSLLAGSCNFTVTELEVFY